MPECLDKRLLHDVIGLLPGAKQKGRPVRAQGVTGDQHAIGVKVAAAGAGYRLGVVDGTPRSALLSPGHAINTPSAVTEFPATDMTLFPGFPGDVDPGCGYDWLILSNSAATERRQ